MKVGKVCRDEGAGEFCMRGTYATKDIKVHNPKLLQCCLSCTSWGPSVDAVVFQLSRDHVRRCHGSALCSCLQCHKSAVSCNVTT